jgi:hypothetical protein
VRGTWWRDSFTEDPEEYVKEGSENGHLSPYWPCWRTWRGGSFPEDFHIQTKEGSGNGAPLSMVVL